MAIDLKAAVNHLLKQLKPEERLAISEEIAAIDPEMFKRQQQAFQAAYTQKNRFEPVADVGFAGSEQDRLSGLKLIAEGRVGCLLIAGGQGTRLRLDSPKGMCPVSVIKHKTLFQLAAEKVAAAGIQAGCQLQMAIMTSPINHQAIVDFFTAHHFFGLKPNQVAFFTQPTLPFLDDKGHLVLKDGHIARGPDGNGSSLKAFFNAGIWQQWADAGIRYVNYILIDNPLADPFDAELVGFHAHMQADITVKAVERMDSTEKVGILVQDKGKTQVVEYSEISDSERVAMQDGKLKHPYANISLFCLGMDFIRQCASLDMPLHAAVKPISGAANAPKITKFETFVFDILPSAKKVSILVFPRETCFAPLKNAEGSDSLATVQEALQQRDRNIFKHITGHEAPHVPFELSQAFHYPTSELIAKWRGKPFPVNTDYLEGIQAVPGRYPGRPWKVARPSRPG